MSLRAAIGLDMRVQARSQLYSIGVGVAVLQGLILRFLIPPEHRSAGLAAFYMLALGGTTYMFSAVTVLWDKSQNTLDALRVAPMNASTYVTSKTLTLSGFAMVEAALVYAVAGGWPAPIGALAAGVAAVAVIYTLLGLAQVAPHDAVTRFLIPDAMVVSVILQLPVLHILGLGPTEVWLLIPTMPAVLLMRSGDIALSPAAWAYVVLGLGAVLVVAWRLAVGRLQRHAGL